MPKKLRSISVTAKTHRVAQRADQLNITQAALVERACSERRLRELQRALDERRAFDAAADDQELA